MDLHKRSVLIVDVLLEMMNAHYAAQRPGTDTTALKAIAEKMELAIEQALPPARDATNQRSAHRNTVQTASGMTPGVVEIAANFFHEPAAARVAASRRLCRVPFGHCPV